jgi:hypothetical protein
MKSRPIEVLRIGTKARFLNVAGLYTLGDLVLDGVVDRLPKIRGIGQKTADLISKRLSAILQSATDNGGEPDWDGIALAWGFNPTPSEPVADSNNFRAVLPEVIAKLIESYESAMDRLILMERIGRTHAERMTLEAIGGKFNVTRERVRQRQARLLGDISDALINDDQSYVPLHFRESFRGFWVRAANHFKDIIELDFREFERGLEEVWGLPAGELAQFMPLASAILTDGVRIPATGSNIHAGLASVPDAILNQPLREFPTRRAREGLERLGIFSFGLLLQAAREDRLPDGRDGRIAMDILSGVGKALVEGPAAGADALAAGLGLTALPRVDPADGAAFIGCLDDALAEAAKLNGTSVRADKIYQLRTCVPRRHRPTLAEVAVELETYGPSVKREETILLASLHTQLVEGDMTYAAVLWKPRFREFFKASMEIYVDSAGDYREFCSLLGRRWSIGTDHVRDRVEGLWSVLSRYPGGRRVRLPQDGMAAPVRSLEGVSLPTAPSRGVVVLRGFRRPH